MKYFFSGILLIIAMGSLSAQTFIGQLNPFPEASIQATTADDTVKILAVMVSFKQDQDGTTFGNGKFESIYTQNYGNEILDPLPHDKPYFESHLQFVKNYFEKVSKGKLTIDYTVLPDTFSVSQTMRNYSPDPGSDDFTRLGDFSIEAWELADQINPGFDFSEYDVFLVFHAGVGRDVSLPGSIGNERDLPSVYLSLNAFKEIYGESFDGISVSNGAFKITNSMIIPETESRELETISGKFLFEITINGLLCASVASHLGLPDLFDTETGLSAIGRFGLMDGQGIFAFLGTYPPEPSPWSKLRLGWAEAVTLDLQNTNVSVVTNIASAMGDTVILKVPLNSSEYYLIENRIRDANSDGSKVTLSVGGSVITKTFINDTTGYQSFDIDSLAGVILDVDEFDWAVPGEGIVIWHVDENVINEKIAENKINTDKNMRGVDIEEADGVQDIGERFFTIFGDEVIGEGFEEDFWYSSNPAELYQNLFNKETRPDTRTNTGANSLITLKDFSEIANRMSFKVEFGDSVVKPIFSFEGIFQLTKSISLAASTQEIRFWFEMPAVTELVNYEGFILFIANFSNYKTPSILLNGISYTYGTKYNRFRAYITDGVSTFIGADDLTSNIFCAPVIRENINSEYEVLLGTSKGQILVYNLGSLPSSDPQLKNSFEFDPNIVVKQIAASKSYFSFIADSSLAASDPLFYDSDGNSFSFNGEIPITLGLTKNAEGNYVNIVLTDAKIIYIISNGNLLNSFSLKGVNDIASFALVDLKQDGTNYIVLNNGSNIEVYNLAGSLADNFPFSDPNEVGFYGTPLTTDFEGDSNSEIISITEDGRIYALDGGTGKVVTGFPISSGAGSSVTPVFYNADGKTNLAVLNDRNIFAGWSISS
ncbi:MAG: hypothetical protein HKP17_12255, partial [Ignavibacteriaceae bacterium]|nr:hypothetical protein [Ignavibacteriaceae bacterium]